MMVLGRGEDPFIPGHPRIVECSFDWSMFCGLIVGAGRAGEERVTDRWESGNGTFITYICRKLWSGDVTGSVDTPRQPSSYASNLPACPNREPGSNYST